MIADDNELQVTLERIARMQQQVAELRRKETNPTLIVFPFPVIWLKLTACNLKFGNISNFTPQN
ncbi:MAG: hypothetical protein ONB44_22285 [candidate division KSB1 bacterium]|nr:hypothetical protein [candidate division KSB1 bacterium]MDZ7304866.1 hypothetical protein [candidate division KSB1 bacterium]MDZ7314119.1 hypothetical protein [candidate division KSB1 bacterium]